MLYQIIKIESVHVYFPVFSRFDPVFPRTLLEALGVQIHVSAQIHVSLRTLPCVRRLPEAKAWQLAAHWAAWEEDPPVWYTAAWRRKVGKNFPAEWFPEAARSQLEAERAERAAQRAISSL